MIRALILDDEASNISVLKYDLEQYCPEIEICAEFTQPVEALKYLASNKIDALFLDVTMPIMSGFEFLSCQKDIDYQVVFVTAHQEYAINAFDFYAVDYIVKPVSKDKLLRAAERLKTRIASHEDSGINVLLETMKKNTDKANHLAIPTMEGFEMVNLENLLYLTASGNYTNLRIKSKDMLVSKTIGDFEKILDPSKFVRIHNSAIVQIKEIKKYIKGDGGQVTMSDGQILSVSRANKPKLLSLIKVDF